MQKQLTLTPALLISTGSNTSAADGPTSLLSGLGAVVALATVAKASIDAYQNGDGSALGSSALLAAIGAGFGYFSKAGNTQAAMAAGATFGFGIGISSAVAHNETVVNALEKTPVINFVFTDRKIKDENGKEHIVTGHGSTARSAATYLAVSAGLIPLVGALTGLPIKDYTLR